MSTSVNTGCSRGVGLLALLLAGAAMAQQQPVSDGEPPLAEIVVTSLKISQTAQSVPAAVTAVTRDEIDKLGVTDLESLAALVPSLQINTIRTQASITFRGVGQTLNSPNADPQNAVNINGLYVPMEMSGVSFYDVERAEAVPGPQGTLYGHNATGGVVNVITKRPGTEYGGEGFVEYGNYQTVHAFAALDVPVNDQFAVRGALNVLSHNGYYNNGEDDADSKAGRLTGVWKPSADTRFTGIVSYSHDGGIGNTQQNNPPPQGHWRDLSFDPEALGYFARFNTFSGSLELNHDFGNHLTFTYQGGYNSLTALQKNATWAGPPPAPGINKYSTEETSHEARINGDWDRLAVIAGLYYFSSRSPYTADVTPRAGLESINGPFVSRSNSDALFGQLTYTVAPGLRLTGGARESQTQKRLDGTNTTISNNVSSVIVYDGVHTLNRTDWKLGFEKDLFNSSMLYGNVATGFTPGGFSTATAGAGSTAAVPFSPITLTAYTAGLKNRFLDNRLTVNVEGFYYDYRNFQVSARNALTNQNTVYNAGKAEVYGAQIDVLYSPTASDRVAVSLSPLKARAITLVTPVCHCDGYDLPYAPKLTGDLSYRHVFGLSSGAQVIALAQFRYTGSQWAFYNHPEGGLIPSYTTTDVDLTYQPRTGRWSVGAFARNLEDSVIRTAGIPNAIPGPTSYFLAAPRTYGVRFSLALQ